MYYSCSRVTLTSMQVQNGQSNFPGKSRRGLSPSITDWISPPRDNNNMASPCARVNTNSPVVNVTPDLSTNEKRTLIRHSQNRSGFLSNFMPDITNDTQRTWSIQDREDVISVLGTYQAAYVNSVTANRQRRCKWATGIYWRLWIPLGLVLVRPTTEERARLRNQNDRLRC